MKRQSYQIADSTQLGEELLTCPFCYLPRDRGDFIDPALHIYSYMCNYCRKFVSGKVSSRIITKDIEAISKHTCLFTKNKYNQCFLYSTSGSTMFSMESHFSS